MDSFNEIWEAVLAYCKERVTETAYNLWIAPLKAIELRDSDVVLSLSNEFQKDIIMRLIMLKNCMTPLSLKVM